RPVKIAVQLRCDDNRASGRGGGGLIFEVNRVGERGAGRNEIFGAITGRSGDVVWIVWRSWIGPPTIVWSMSRIGTVSSSTPCRSRRAGPRIAIGIRRDGVTLILWRLLRGLLLVVLHRRHFWNGYDVHIPLGGE